MIFRAHFGEYRPPTDHYSLLRSSCFPILVFALLLPSQALAAWAVYGDSWSSATQAQEQVAQVNRSLRGQTANYERAVVQGRTYWRVRIGVYATRAEALNARRQGTAAGVKEPWVREVPDSELQTQLAAGTQPSAVVQSDSARTDSLAQVFMDSLARATRRRVDSLGRASQRQTRDVMEQMRLQITQELVERVEQAQAHDRSSYVTTAEQSQMTRALIDEMTSRMESLQDSLRREKAEQDARAALRPHISGYVASNGTLVHDRPAVGGLSTTAGVHLTSAQVALTWSADQSKVLLDARVNAASGLAVNQAYVMWSFARAHGVRRTLGLGIFELPYGLEPSRAQDLLTCTPSQVSSSIPGPQHGMMIIPHDGDRVTLNLFPYGSWDEGTQAGVAQFALHTETVRLEITGGGERIRRANASFPHGNEFSALGDGVVAWESDRWVLGVEGTFERRMQPVYATLGVARQQTDTWGALGLMHRRFSTKWGWTLRGEFTTRVTTWSDTYEVAAMRPASPLPFYPPKEPLERHWVATAGPAFFVSERLRILLNYSYWLDEVRGTGESKFSRDQQHRLTLSMSHAF